MTPGTPDNKRHTVQAHELVVPRTARFASLGYALNEAPNELWWVFHGYGQLARYFIRHFQPLADGSRTIIAPEGLSRFYLGENKWERVGASWMTKEDRLQEIADQHTYLNALRDHVYAPWAGRPERVVVLGFSQGVATSWRWLDQTPEADLPCTDYVVWAGSPPNEQHHLRKRNLQLRLVYGTQDPFITPEREAQLQAALIQLDTQLPVHCFEGGHTLESNTLQAVAEAIRLNGKRA